MFGCIQSDGAGRGQSYHVLSSEKLPSPLEAAEAVQHSSKPGFNQKNRVPDVVWNLLTNIALAVANFLISILLARALSPTGRGDLAAALVWPTVISHLALMGIHLQIGRMIGRASHRARNYYRHAFFSAGLFVALSSLAWIVVNLTLPVPGISGDLVLIAVTTGIILFSAMNAMQITIELGRNSIGTYNLCRIAFTGFYSLSVLGLFFWGYNSYPVFLVAFAGATVFAAVTAQIVIRRSIGRLERTASASAAIDQVSQTPLSLRLTDTVRDAWPFALSTALLASATTADKVIVSSLFDAHTMGIYVIAMTMSQLQMVVNEAISPLFFVRAGAHTKIENIDFGWLSQRTRQSIIINLSICIGLTATLPVMLPLFFGSAYSESLILAAMLIPAVGVRSMMRPFEEVLKGGGRAHSQSRAILLMLLVFVGGSLYAAHLGSVLGVAVAMLVSSVAGLIFVVVSVADQFSKSPHHFILPRSSDFGMLLHSALRIIKM